MDAITPRLLSVRVTGDEIEHFADAAPTSHIRVFLPAPDQTAPTMPITTATGRSWPEGDPRPVVRTYTPRAYDSQARMLEIQFVLHGSGPAAQWALRATPGDRIAIGGPGGRFTADMATERWWIAGDESALPAVGTLLDTLPASASVEAHLEVEGPQDELPLASAAELKVVWHHRQRANAFGAELIDAARSSTITPGTQVWAACEAAAVRHIRQVMLADKRVPVAALVTRGYWRLGESDHPDHDYGVD